VDGQSVTQVVLEGLTKKYLGLAPTLFSPFALTSENEHKAIYEYHPPEGSSSTAKWITVLFFPGVPEWEGRSNRLRVLLGIERFFYPSRMRFAEVDLSKEGGVYRTLIHNGADLPLPTEPELWVIDPDTHRAAKYTSPKGETIADLTHERLRDWLTSNSVALPTDGGLVTQRAFPELERLQKQTQDELRADPASSKGPP